MKTKEWASKYNEMLECVSVDCDDSGEITIAKGK